MLTVLFSGCEPRGADEADAGPYRSCREDANCPPGEVCWDGAACHPAECEDNRACATWDGETCFRGRCIVGSCIDATDCGPGEICHRRAEGMWTRSSCFLENGCEDLWDCPPDFSCTDRGLCVAPTLGAPCETDTVCPPDEWCDYRSTCARACPARSPECGACRTDADCPADYPACFSGGACRGESAMCQFDFECLPEMSCVDRACVEPCLNDIDCQPGESCQDGFCHDAYGECASSADCPADERCFDGRCLCRGCQPYYGWAPRPCSEDAWCGPASGSVCREGGCRPACPTMTDDECVALDPRAPVCRADETTGEYLCHSVHELTPECSTRADCPSDAHCVDGACVAP